MFKKYRKIRNLEINRIFSPTFFAALGFPGWLGLDRSAAIAIVMAIVLITAALGTAYKLYHCRRNRELRNDEARTANTGQYHGNISYFTPIKMFN
jgi:hypothetical protein